ncbi:acyltransferase family protein [Burkholderia plantarii]|uniref:acyltransferase family protein n=1 Tax=Burkholderia plantarii TaxID=41899 RepID=UPI0018DB477C|nr:acyltransferase [Burkholderia plantarii]MBI0330467.1 acyltransferase [Burkholderia plantarii]
MLIKDILQRDNNNFELLRLIAASVVIVGHAHNLAGDTSGRDFVLEHFRFDYSGGLAVKFFFLLSGLVVTNSLLANPSLRRFAAARIARIFPALIVVILLTTYVMGPLLTTLPVGTYLGSHETLLYVWQNLKLHSNYVLPGVCGNAPEKGVNGAIWTIPVECFCYLALAAVSLVGLARNRVLFSLACVAFIAVLMRYPQAAPQLHLPLASAPIVIDFAAGALLAIWKDRVALNGPVVLALLAATCLFRDTEALRYFACATLFLGAIWLSTLPAVRKLRLPGDFSYGTYLSGWIMQQLIHAAFPGMGATGNWMLAVPLAIGFGAISWHLIEQPGMRLGKAIGTGRLRVAPPVAAPAADDGIITPIAPLSS